LSRNMRPSRVLPALCLLFGARASQLDSRVPHILDARELLDVCALLDMELVVPDIHGILTAVGFISGTLTFVSKFTSVVFLFLTLRQTHASACREFLSSSRRTWPGSWPSRLPDSKQPLTFWRNWSVDSSSSIRPARPVFCLV